MTIDERFARALHLTTKTTPHGGAFAPPIVSTSVYALPPDPAGPYQYARWANPTWTALEEALGVLEDAEVVTLPSGMRDQVADGFVRLSVGCEPTEALWAEVSRALEAV